MAQDAGAIDWTFEGGRLQGWTKSGTAFNNQPTYGNNVAARRPGIVINHQRLYWIGTYENRPSLGTAEGTIQGDAPTGTLTSAPFTVRMSSLNFLVGGGNDINRLRVELLVKLSPGEERPILPILGIGQRVNQPDGTYTVQAYVTGRNDEVMRSDRFDLAPYLNKVARIRIVDESTRAWGHINVDGFQFTGGPPGDVWITGIETTQAVQRYPYANVPLVGGKKTLVRVYVQSREDSRGAWNDVTARLTVRKGTINRLHTPVGAGPNYTAVVSPAGSDRQRLSESFNFLLDSDETLPGEGELEVRLNSISQRVEDNLANNVRVERIRFGRVLNYWIYGATYSIYSTTNPEGNQPAAAWSDFQAHRLYTQNVFPLASFGIVPFAGNPVPRFNWDASGVPDAAHSERFGGEAYRWAVEMLGRQPDGARRGLYMLMPNANPCYCGVEYTSTRVMFGHNPRDRRGGEIMAHEVGHFCGMHHVQTTPTGEWPLGPTAPEPHELDYPYPRSWVGPALGVSFNETGTGMPFSIVLPGTDQSSDRYSDIMSYGPPLWVSDFTYQRLMDSEALRMSWFDRGGFEQPRYTEIAQRLYVSGWIRPGGKSAEFNPFRLTTPATGQEGVMAFKEGATYNLRLESGEGKVLGEQKFDAAPGFDFSNSPPFSAQKQRNTASAELAAIPFGISLLFEPSTRRIVLRKGDAVLAERSVSPNAPAVQLVQCPGAHEEWKGSKIISWKADDPDNDALTFAVEYSANGGESWVPIDVLLTKTSLEVDFACVPGSEKALLRVLANDGVHTSEARLPATFRVPRKRPEVTIMANGGAEKKNGFTAPAAAIQGEPATSAAQPLVLTGSALDWEDGAITEPNAYRWASNRDGVVGTGFWIVLGKLSSGRHRITLTVTDKEGSSSSASVYVTAQN